MSHFENLIEVKTGTQEIYDGVVVHLYKDTVSLPNSHPAVREVIRHVGAVGVLPLTDDGKVIIERQFRYPLNRVITEIPAGKLDSFTEDRLSAAQRELEEETGIRAAAEEFELLLTVRDRNTFYDHYCLKRDVPLSEIVLQPGETDGAQWATFEQIHELIREKQICDVIAQQFLQQEPELRKRQFA